MSEWPPIAIILAGGVGRRLQAVVADLPKPMADVAGRPFLAHVLDHLVDHGVRKAVLSVGYKHELIQRHLGARYRTLDLSYAIERERLGTGGALKYALAHAGDADRVLVLNGDTLFKIDLAQLFAAHVRAGSVLSVALRSMEDTGRYGRVALDPDGRIAGFREKQSQTPGLVNAGIYVVEGHWYKGLPTSAVFSFEKDVLEAWHATERFLGVPFDGYFIDIGVPEDYDRARRELT